MDKLFTFIFIFAFGFLSPVLLAQEESNDMAAAAWGEKKQNSSGLPGKECQAFMGSKGWSAQMSNKRGEMDYYFVGTGSIQAPVTSPNFANSTQNGATKALNDAKAQFARFLSQEVISETTQTLVDAVRDGVPPETVLGEEAISEGRDYEELSSVEKMKLLIHQQLDKLIDQETKDGVAEDNAARQEMANKIQEIVSQESFQQTITAQSTAEMRGMLVKYGHYTADASRGNNSYVCVVAKWNPGYARVVDAMVTKDFSIIEGKRGRPSPSIPSDQTFEGFSQLIGSFGTYYFINENGELELWSFAQSAVSGNNIQAKRAAIGRAETKARAQISEFLNTSLDLKEKTKDSETTTNFADESSDYYGESAYEQRLATASRSTLTGVTRIKEYLGPHVLPSQKNEVAGVILSWTPSGDRSATTASKQLADKPSASTKKDESVGFESDADDAVSSGASYGDDEDEDF